MYGTFMKSIREAEDHFSEQMYDFTFPVYRSKMDKDLYRDQPFVTVVAAPRVVLLVYDGPQVKKKVFQVSSFLSFFSDNYSRTHFNLKQFAGIPDELGGAMAHILSRRIVKPKCTWREQRLESDVPPTRTKNKTRLDINHTHVYPKISLLYLRLAIVT